jgi:hypothetical protein
VIEIYPKLSQFGWKCPACGCQLSEAKSILFQGQHVLADISCTCCDVEYFQTYPVGHGAVFPVSFTKAGEKSIYGQVTKWWMAKPLIDSIVSNEQFEPSIDVVVYRKFENGIILNCLDDCWGHVFMKLLNAQKHLDDNPETGLILLIPASFKWLIPEGIAEAWLVNAPLIDFRKRIFNLETFVKTQFGRFGRVSLSEADIRPNLSNLDTSKFTKTEKFDFVSTDQLAITFIWREDRFWQTSKVEEWMFLASTKFKLFDFVKPFFARRQMAHFDSLAKIISKVHPHATIKLVGIGKLMNANSFILDVRETEYSESIETEFCRIYAQSHVVVGVHGSNMLLPTTLAGGFVDLVPSWKLERWGEDIAQPFLEGRSVLLGRCLEGISSAKKVAKHVLSIFENQRIYKTK